jgi:L-rhamnose isomerase/sugar isomerase
MADTIIAQDVIAQENEKRAAALKSDYEALGANLSRRGVDIEAITRRVGEFFVAVPSWGVGTGGTRFARFPGTGEPRGIFDKLDDCSVINELTRATPNVSLHIPWDKTDVKELKAKGDALGLGFDAMNSNTFSDAPGQAFLQIRLAQPCGRRNPRAGCRAQSRMHRDRQGDRLQGADGLDRRRLELPRPEQFHPLLRALSRHRWRYLQGVAGRLALFSEHKMYEPAFYSTVVQDWGTNYLIAQTLGEKAIASSTSATMRRTPISR